MNQELNRQKLKAMHVAAVERERCFDAEIAWQLLSLRVVSDVALNIFLILKRIP